MKLVSFSITNYRSITTAHKIILDKYTVLVGKNNEGKSNILRALDLVMNILINHSMNHARFASTNGNVHLRNSYNWENDFPIQIQNRKKGLQSIFRLEFNLNDDELAEFHTEIGSKLNGNIAIEIKIDKNNTYNLKSLKILYLRAHQYQMPYKYSSVLL
ncbi:MAG: AAA family ATPase [Clostridia bacterium]|nr:AAA family ATPase [Clostridia bacterium]